MFRERMGSTDNSLEKKKYKETERKHPAADVIHPVYIQCFVYKPEKCAVQLAQLPTISQAAMLHLHRGSSWKSSHRRLPVTQDTCPVISHMRIDLMS